MDGEVFTTGSDQQRALVPGVRLWIQCVETSAPAVEAFTNAIGRFLVDGLAPCRYRVTAEFSGMQAAPIEAEVQANRVANVEVELKPKSLKEEVTVSAQVDVIDTTETSSKAVLHQSTIEHAPNLTERLDGLLPLLPGVVRGPDGLINMKGARTSQGGMLLNSANVTDPVTGGSGLNLPIDVVSTAQVVANPYDPEYGKMAGAVSTVDTRVSSFDKFNFRVQNFMPRMRRRDGSIMGIESATPRMTATGPLVPGRVALTQSLEYHYIRTPVETLPPLERDTELESFDSYTQLDLNLTERQNASVTLVFYPQKLNYLGLNTFTPQEATPDLHQRGHFLAFSHKFTMRSGALLSSQISAKTLDSDVKPHNNLQYRMEVETTAGGFFNRQDRDTSRLEWQEVLSPRAMTGWGNHQLKVGWNFLRNVYDGEHTFSPVEVLRGSGMLAERTEFSPGVTMSVHQREYTGFVQDKWTIHRKLTLDAGVRIDRDSLSDEAHVAPRIGLAIAPFQSGLTVIRGGVGYFYDRINLNIPTFTHLPERTVTRFSEAGSMSRRLAYPHILAGPLDNPRSTAWNLEVQKQVIPNLLLRAGYSQRITVRNFFLEPVQAADSGCLMLSNAGRDRYREFDVTARYQIRGHVLNASYVRSGAIGDLNDFNQFFGNTPNPIIRPNERGRMPFDAPNRFVFWGQFEAPWKITIAPVWDIHTGFPYSVFDEERDFIGERNKAGRFPRFSSTDLQVTKAVRLPMLGGKYKAHVGIRIFNMFNHYNPRDFQANTASPRYGAFLNSVDRMVRGKLVLEF
jgi:outer membrane receptor protein involved in Fe transport